MKKHILGFPRMGAQRELKFALESFWKGKSSLDELEAVSRELRARHWGIQRDAGLDTVATGDFSWYDQVLDTSLMLGAVPARFRGLAAGAETYFAMARGDQKRNIAAMEMTKWFNTNYHYIVPEIEPDFAPALLSAKIVDETAEAVAAGFAAKPVLVGPITYLSLAKGVDGADPWSKLDGIAEVYCEVIRRLAAQCEWIQLDEPILCADLPAAGRAAFAVTYRKLNAAAGGAKLMLATYFDNLDENLDLALASGCAALHLDLVRGGRNLDDVLAKLPAGMALSAGVIEGRNIWRNDFAASLAKLRKIADKIGPDRLMVASSCSLLHAPVTLAGETKLDAELKSWLAFATEKCAEVAALAGYAAAEGEPADEAWRTNQAAIASRRTSARVHDAAVQARVAAATPEMAKRKSAFPERRKAQAWLALPPFPTTTIGSFPQTAEIRRARLAFRKGEMAEADYRAFMQGEIRSVVEKQEAIGLDVLVHGEPERNDMVEYFGQQMAGFCFTANGWVQSYGSRCVKPPVIFGDVSRPKPMTVDWITYAQSVTKKPMKGMLTGPVTILCWSFVRDDLPRETVCRQIALAIRDEVADLEAAGIRVIQIDEAALSEGRPVKERDHAAYFDWAVEAFRLATCCVADSTQIHTHMCYSEFNKMIRAIAAMDADVISIEASRSKMELLDAFRTYEYPNGIGPGVYDIHSPRIPETAEIVGLLEKAAEYIPADRLWVNPDCGLKTRDWAEVVPSLEHMVEAAKIIRAKLA